jgi:restriction system protein
VRISLEGRGVLAQNPGEINMKFLEKYPGYMEFMRRSRKVRDDEPTAEIESEELEKQTPQESLYLAYQTLREATKEELLTRLKNCSPRFFERAVMRVLLAMGYGGIQGDGDVTGQPGDGGIDGVIREDKLGLDLVCVQAKRWSENAISRATVQQFAGSMDIYKAKKGVILTTSTFSREAVSFVERIEGKRVVLIDGDRLTELMIDYNVGVTTTDTYEIKEVSNDFFDEDAG